MNYKELDGLTSDIRARLGFFSCVPSVWLPNYGPSVRCRGPRNVLECITFPSYDPFVRFIKFIKFTFSSFPLLNTWVLRSWMAFTKHPHIHKSRSVSRTKSPSSAQTLESYCFMGRKGPWYYCLSQTKFCVSKEMKTLPNTTPANIQDR